MLKHKGRESREEKRRENKRGRRSLCWSFGVFFPWTVSPGAAPVGDPKMLEVEKLQPRKVLIPQCGHRSLPGRALAAAGRGQCWEHRVQWESPPVNWGAGAQWEITALGQLARKVFWKLFILFEKKNWFSELKTFFLPIQIQNICLPAGGKPKQ